MNKSKAGSTIKNAVISKMKFLNKSNKNNKDNDPISPFSKENIFTLKPLKK